MEKRYGIGFVFFFMLFICSSIAYKYNYGQTPTVKFHREKTKTLQMSDISPETVFKEKLVCQRYNSHPNNIQTITLLFTFRAYIYFYN